MRKLVTAALMLGIFGISACDEPVSQPDRIVDPIAAFMPIAACDVKDAIDLMKDYLPKALHKDAAATLRDLGDACEVDIQGAGPTQIVFSLLVQVEQVLADEIAAGGPGDGAAYVTELLGFGEFCDDVCAVPAGVFDVGGAFGVRDPSDSAPVESSYPSSALKWTLEPPGMGEQWIDILPVRVLFIGYPGSDNPVSEETVISANEFYWEKLPDVDFLDPEVHQPVVAYCGDGSASQNPTIQRFDEEDLGVFGTTLLQTGISQVCDGASSADASSSLGVRALRFASRLFGPTELAASALFGGGVGGKPRDFSRFVAVNSVPASLVFLTQPQDAVRDKETGLTEPFDIQVRALTDLGEDRQGTPIENIELQISAQENNGNTVVLSGGTTALTIEQGGVATFEGLQLNKTGGYNLHVTVAPLGDEGFVIADAVSDRFNVRGSG